MNEQLEFCRRIAQRLDSAGIPYMLTGSLAMTVYATPRMTRDIDIVVELHAADVARIVALFGQDAYIDEDAVRYAIAGRGMFNIISNDSIIKADFIVRKDDPYRIEEFRRRARVDVGGFSLSVVSPEDLVLSKIAWNPESELQARDVANIVESVPSLDWPYMESWASRLGVRDVIERLRR